MYYNTKCRILGAVVVKEKTNADSGGDGYGYEWSILSSCGGGWYNLALDRSV